MAWTNLLELQSRSAAQTAFRSKPSGSWPPAAPEPLGKEELCAGYLKHCTCGMEIAVLPVRETARENLKPTTLIQPINTKARSSPSPASFVCDPLLPAPHSQVSLPSLQHPDRPLP